MTRDALEQNQVPIYFVAVIVAAIGGLLAPNTAQGLSVLVTPTIAVLMYAMFLQIPFLNLKDQAISNRPQGLGRRVFVSVSIMVDIYPLQEWVARELPPTRHRLW